MRNAINDFRAFNRFYTRLLGLFDRHLPGGALPLAEARVLYEVAWTPGLSAAEVSRRLDMDAGQLSRILGGLRKRGLVERSGSPRGRRALPLAPTPAGLERLRELELGADARAEALLSGLTADRRRRLRSAMAEVRALLGDAGEESGHELAVRSARSGELGWIITRHAEVYGAEHGFDEDFERYVLLGMAEYCRMAVEGAAEGSGVWVAEHGGAPVGGVGVVRLGPDAAQLRWLLVEPWARGLGAGRLLVERAVAFAREHGYARLELKTLQHLHAAKRLYASSGFTRREEFPGVMGGRPVVEEFWVLDL